MYRVPRQKLFEEKLESDRTNSTSAVGELLISIFDATG